jgi:hypothetical protein
MKKILFTMAMVLAAGVSFGQESSNVTTSIKPADESPVVYTTREELESKNVGKIDAMKLQIEQAKGDEKKVLYLRKELWRFENAIVAGEKK